VVSVGSGVWRLRWHPTESALAAACMYEGFHIFRLEAELGLRKEQSYETEGLAYGIDWITSNDLIACTFYKRQVLFLSSN